MSPKDDDGPHKLSKKRMYRNEDIVNCFLGGLLLGFVVASRRVLLGNITGISGIFSDVIKLDLNILSHERLNKLLFVGGLLLAGIFGVYHSPEAFDDWSKVPLSRLLIGAFFVGYGTFIGNGCTSGHGVCGVSYFRPRSIVATVTFMGIAIIVATFFHSSSYFKPFKNNYSITAASSYIFPLIGGSILFILIGKYIENTYSFIFTPFLELYYGFGFGVAMLVSNMVKPSATLAFLDIYHWYPVLVLVMAAAIAVTAPTFYYIRHWDKPILGHLFTTPKFNDIDIRLILGSLFFGTGWGLTGICPGPLLVNIPTLRTPQLIFLATYILGVYIATLQEGLWFHYMNTTSITQSCIHGQQCTATATTTSDDSSLIYQSNPLGSPPHRV